MLEVGVMIKVGVRVDAYGTQKGWCTNCLNVIHVTVVITHVEACIEDRTVPPILWRYTSPATATVTVT